MRNGEGRLERGKEEGSEEKGKGRNREKRVNDKVWVVEEKGVREV